MPLSTPKIIAITSLTLLNACATASRGQVSATPTPWTFVAPTPLILPTIDTRVLPQAPEPRQVHQLSGSERQRLERLAAKGGACKTVGAARTIDGQLYAGCNGKVAILDPRTGRAIRSQIVKTGYVQGIEPAGDSAIAVMGSRDGAMIVDDLFFLDARTLKQINKQQMSDTLFLGVIGDRAYLDNLCCFGRSGEYRPATIYTMSLRNGSTTVPVDLRPDADGHAADQDPPGQGDRSYLIGRTFYLVVYDPRYHVDFAYRYDITHLDRPPVRMRAYAPQPPGAGRPAL